MFDVSPSAASSNCTVSVKFESTSTAKSWSSWCTHFVISILDYCNIILAGLPNGLLSQVQRVQNAAARLVLGLQPRDHMKLALFELHWLPVHLTLIISCVCWCILLLSSVVSDTSATLFRPLLHHLADNDYVPLRIHFHIHFHRPKPSLENGRFQWLVH